MGCGFTTSTLMEGQSKVVKDALETSPELYKDLIFKDGTSKTSWQWSAVKAIELTEVEKESGKFPEGQTHRMDMKNAKLFGQKEFMDALEVIGFYEVSE